MIRTCRPCSSSEQPYRWPARPVSCGSHPERPCLRKIRSCTCYAFPVRPGLAISKMLPTPLLLLLLYDLLQLRRHWRNPFPHNLHFAAWSAAHDNIQFTKRLVFTLKILAEMSTAALLAFDRGPGNCLRNGSKLCQVHRGVPSRVVL